MALTVLVAGGGTGGHLYPGIAVVRELLRRVPDARVSFVGTARGLETRIVPAEGFELDVIRSAGLKGKSIVATIRGLGLLPLGLADAWRALSRRRPHVVIGVGGYSSGPVVLLASWRGIATMVLEQNATPGLTNRLLARWVRAAAVTFEETLTWFRGRGFVAGNPVRAEFFDEPSPKEAEGRRSAQRRILVLGGSQGAHAINVAMLAAATEFHRRGHDLDLVHQTGARDVAAIRSGYHDAGVAARVEPFLPRVADEMKAADLVICRAGATTLAELAAVGRPAVLVPFPGATDDHQRRNAAVLAAAGATLVIDERDLSTDRLVDEVGGLIGDSGRLDAMRRAIRGFAKPQAAACIVDRILELAKASGVEPGASLVGP